MKLSKTQEEIVKLMKEGWQLASHRDWTDWCSIQKGGIGYGGESKIVSSATVWALKKKGIIIIDKETIPTTTYKLNPKPSKVRKR